MRSAFETIIENKDNDFIRHMANYIGNILNENAFVSRFYIDMIILLGRKKLQAETIIRISIIMHILREYPQDVRAYLTNILEAFKENSELLDIIKQDLLICLQDMKEEEVDKYIKEYWSLLIKLIAFNFVVLDKCRLFIELIDFIEIIYNLT